MKKISHGYYMTYLKKKTFTGCLILFMVSGLLLSNAKAQGQHAEVAEPEEITLTLEEAVQIALVNNYMIRKGLLDLDIANAQIREAWGSVYPQVNATGNYTRNLQTPNPFAGSDAGGLFETFGAIGWLAYNEQARTDGDPNTDPISFDEFLDRQREGYDDAGISPPGLDGGNPFAVENQFDFGISVSQAIYNGAAFAAIKGARQFRKLSEDQIDLERQAVVDEVRRSFYTALLAKEQVDVIRSSVERLRETVEDTRRSVDAGILSRYDRISAEVELVNLETNLIEAENQAYLATKALSLQLGIPTRKKVELRGALEYQENLEPEFLNADLAYELALQQRPDLSQSETMIDLLNIERDIAKSAFLPTVSAFANAAYIGSVPSNRLSISPVEGQEFTFTSETRSFFDDSYWNPAVAVGLRLNWSIFNGFQTRMRVQQRQIEIKKAEVDREFQKNAIYLEIDQSVRSVETALKRIQSQERNIEQAQLNYEFARTRLNEGAGTALQERQASSLLDQSKLNYLSAVYDYLVAVSQYKKAIGSPVLDGQQY
jgi:outer membrane protein TolC